MSVWYSMRKYCTTLSMLFSRDYRDIVFVFWYYFCRGCYLSGRNHRRVWRYQRSNQNPYIEEEQTTQWPKEKSTNKRSTKHTHKTKDRVTRTPLKTGGELRCSGRSGWNHKRVCLRGLNLMISVFIFLINN